MSAPAKATPPPAPAAPEPLSPRAAEVLAAMDRARRSQRALGLATLFGRAAREVGGCADLRLGQAANIGLCYLEEEFMEELADLLPLPR